MKSACMLLPEEMHFFHGLYATSKRVNNLHEYTLQLFCYIYLNLGMQKGVNFFTRKSQ